MVGGGGIWIKSKACLGWLVGWLLYLLRSRSTEKRELKGAYILLIIIKKKKTPRRERSTSVRYRPHLTGRVGMYVHGRQNRTKSSKRSGYGAMHKVMIGFVFPIGK